MNNIDFDNLQLDKEEREIEEAFEKGSVERVLNYEEEKVKLEAAARATLEKTKNINIRISQGDLYNIKTKAAEQGVPYQTLISSLIHQFSNNRINYNILREPGKPYRTFNSKPTKKSGA
ncbi:MAG: CopG family antitoxin [Candidatus Doudnabacteria bacterium]|nr:CopG family antitoxin [Candidatus Doudnabacteria bacterium]